MYKLIILPPAARFLKRLKEKPLKAAFQKAIDNILLNPYLGHPKTGDLSGIYSCDIFYNKTNYELAYTIIEDPATHSRDFSHELVAGRLCYIKSCS